MDHNQGLIFMIIPYEKSSPEALEGLIEEFVTRDGTAKHRICKKVT
ncbi:YheU family protein [Thermodesulfobacteriota bacterium]